VNGRRPTTRSGEAVKSRGNTGLIIGGACVGIVVIIALLAVASGSDGEKKPVKKRAKKAEAVDVMPKATPSSTHAAHMPKRNIQPMPKTKAKPRKPDSYYKQFVDDKLWTEAKDYANEANQMLRDMKEGIFPKGMDRKAVKKKARELLCMAAEKGKEFMSPLDDRREEAEHFIKLYEDIMMKWIRKSRELLFDSKN
jgi:hypothetical protein